MADHHHHQSTSARSGMRNTELHFSKKWKDKDNTSPERNKVWIEPPPKHKQDRKVSVVYYLSRNGHLQHPHFIEVPLSTPDGLYLRDVINRLDSLRGKGMAGLYSWSCKRSYKSGFVWHDLAENDFIYPAYGQEYVLKGSELPVDSTPAASISKSDETVTSRSEKHSPESKVSGEDSDFPAVIRRRNQSWSSIDLNEYKVYKAESTAESVSKAAADASTQTDDKRRRRRTVIRDIEEEEAEEEEEIREEKSESTTELSRDEISPPPSDSSPETLESLMKAECRIIRVPGSEKSSVHKSTAGNHQQPPPARVKASSVLMQLITCGSVSFTDCGPGALGKNHPGFSLISHYKGRLPRGEGQNQVEKNAGEAAVGSRSFNFRGIRKNKVKVMEDKEYFSGSLIETKKEEFPALKRSSSYNADRMSKLELTEEIDEGLGKEKCNPREEKTESNRSTTTTTESTSIVCDSQQCSIVKMKT